MVPLISVVIPTHNRARYAISAIRSVLAIQDDRIELVVSDTSTDEKLAALIADEKNSCVGDPRLNYFRPREKLDMTGNHNAAIGAARGEYVCLIGDDDTVSAECLVAAEWAMSKGIELISPNVVANYVWPDFRHRFFGGGHASRLYFARQMGGVSLGKSDESLARALVNAAQGTDGLPKIYHGLVKRTLLEKIRQISGAYFHGSSPDVSGAIGLALVGSDFVVIDYPLTIPGASGGSNTGRSAMNKHKGKIEQETQTKGFESEGWSPGVPRFFSVETVWAHAAMETMRRIAPHMISRFNFSRLIAICHVLHPEYDLELKQATIEAGEIVGDTVKLVENIGSEIKRFKRERMMRLIKRVLVPTVAGGRKYTGGVVEVFDAPEALMKYMKKSGVSWGAVSQSVERLIEESKS